MAPSHKNRIAIGRIRQRPCLRAISALDGQALSERLQTIVNNPAASNGASNLQRCRATGYLTLAAVAKCAYASMPTWLVARGNKSVLWIKNRHTPSILISITRFSITPLFLSPKPYLNGSLDGNPDRRGYFLFILAIFLIFTKLLSSEFGSLNDNTSSISPHRLSFCHRRGSPQSRPAR